MRRCCRCSCKFQALLEAEYGGQPHGSSGLRAQTVCPLARESPNWTLLPTRLGALRSAKRTDFGAVTVNVRKSRSRCCRLRDDVARSHQLHDDVTGAVASNFGALPARPLHPWRPARRWCSRSSQTRIQCCAVGDDVARRCCGAGCSERHQDRHLDGSCMVASNQASLGCVTAFARWAVVRAVKVSRQDAVRWRALDVCRRPGACPSD